MNDLPPAVVPAPRPAVPAAARSRIRHILAVDDSSFMRDAVSFTLRNAGFVVTKAADGRQALQIAREQRFDVVVTDVNMPDMDGLALIKALRELPDYKFIPMLMLTTESTRDKREEGKAAGATGWIVKPFAPEQLLTMIRRVLG